jgi:hypothetical protein
MTKLVRLINNEEIIGDIEKTKTGVLIRNGSCLVPMGEGKIALVPWMPYTEEVAIEIKNDKIMFITTPITDLQNEYSQRFGSGLVVPQSPIGDVPNLKLTT